MKRLSHVIKHLIIFSVIALIAGCTVMTPRQPDWQPDKEYHLTILHTNDHHGHFWKNRQGEYGMAARKTLVDNIREEVALDDGHLLLLSGGDINTGVPESDLQNAEPDFKGMRLLGYDAMAIGNHEFDNPLAVLREQQAWAGFPFLSANVFDEKTGKPLFQAYKIFQEGDLKVAVVGFTTDDTVKQGNPENLKGVEIRSPIEVAKKLIPKLAEQADLIIAVTHMGHYDNGQHGSNAPGDVALARAVPGIDVIVGGHSQDPLFKPDVQNGTLILQAHEWGKYLGRLDLMIKNGAIESSHYQLIPINLQKKSVTKKDISQRVLLDDKIAEDPSMIALLTPYQDKGQKELSVKLGKAEGRFIGDRHSVRYRATNLGNLITRAMMEKTKADIGIMNSGGIRDDLPKGIITYKSVLQVQPFGNLVSYVDFSAQELTDYLSAVASIPPGTGGFAQIQGVSLTLENGQATNIKVAGQALDSTRQYRVALNDFSASGGDGYPKITQHPGFVNSGYTDADVLKDYIHSHSPLATQDYAPTGAIKR
ncbi:bifunctional UDP-sugar hydrolase/5'-nucleotidase UshA [Marinomonas pollencensis]|uniref:5'-nucleotidase/UDP-sugar diphosphatase n=1 Tax=Marinomonas pollencensis TaxID=491954 RepID=A0A3E0DGT7_9GAMM|nr:bifunctional UDP-sugar hydrolase/5'-nucleotidase UshA [Marinomonas pollencensis]REG81011.1 5'-nucleotidase/UDP-sugar diphosphatase [Marinomonas pollencensis]